MSLVIASGLVTASGIVERSKEGYPVRTVAELGASWLARDHAYQIVQVSDGTETPATYAYSKDGKWLSVYTQALISTDPAGPWNGLATNINLIELGDSFIANGSNAAGFKSYGIITAANRFSGQRLKRRLDWNFGLGGDDTGGIENRFNTQVVPLLGTQGGFLIVHGGTNDGTAISVDNTLAALTRIRDKALALKVPVIFCTTEPRGNDTFPDKRLAGAQLDAHLQRRTRMLAELPVTGCVVVDVRDKLLKPGTDNDIQERYSHDGLHMNPIGCDEVYGPAIAAAIKKLAPVRALPNGTTARSLNTNVEMLGITGPSVPPTGYSGSNASGTGNVTRAYLETATATGRWAQCTLGGGAATLAAAVDLFRQIGLQAQIAVGKTYVVICEYEIDAGAANVLSLECGIQAVGKVSGTTTTIWDSDRYQENNYLSDKAQAGWYCSPPFTATEELSDFRMRLSAYMSINGAPALVVRARNFELVELTF